MTRQDVIRLCKVCYDNLIEKGDTTITRSIFCACIVRIYAIQYGKMNNGMAYFTASDFLKEKGKKYKEVTRVVEENEYVLRKSTRTVVEDVVYWL